MRWFKLLLPAVVLSAVAILFIVAPSDSLGYASGAATAEQG